MSSKPGAPRAPFSKERERLMRNYERVRSITRQAIENPEALDDRELSARIEDIVFSFGDGFARCCKVTTYLVRGTLLNYDGSIHACRRTPERKPDLYDRTMRGLNRGRT